MQNKDFTKVPIARFPRPEEGESMRKIMSHIGRAYQVKIDNYWDLYQWSLRNYDQFWAEMWDVIQPIHSKSYEKVIDVTMNISDRPEWFTGAKVNYAENILKYRDNRTALIITGEDREAKFVSFAELYAESSRYAAALKKLGVQKNDHVVCLMSNREEPIYAMIGATSLGAIWSGALPLYGAKAVINRFKQTNPKVFFTMDQLRHDGKKLDLLEKIKEIVDGLPSLVKVVIIQREKGSPPKDISEIKNSCFLDSFLAFGENEDGCVPTMEFEQVSFSHPVFINYTSGTTGNPKGVIHGFGGLFMVALSEWLPLHTTRDLMWLLVSPVGWISWNISVTLLSFGCCVVVYEGMPFFRSNTYLWDLVDMFGVTTVFLMPSTLEEMEKKGILPGKHNHLSSLKEILVSGSVVKPQSYDFVVKHFPTVAFNPMYGSTELFGYIFGCDRTLPVYRGELSCPALAREIVCYNESGKSVTGEMGYIVIKTPVPGFPLGILGDEDGTLFKNTYFSKFPDAYSSGDFGIINPVTRGAVICGRCDDILKPKGYRFGSGDIYNIVNTFPEVTNSICVSQYNKVGDERAILFLKMNEKHKLTEKFAQKIRSAIRKELAEYYIPEVILSVPDVPMSINGKKMEILVKKIINKFPYGTDLVANPNCLKYFMDVPELRGY